MKHGRAVKKLGTIPKNRWMSVFALLVRCSLCKILGIMALMAIGEAIVFSNVLYQCKKQITEVLAVTGVKPLLGVLPTQRMITAPEALLDDAYIRYFFMMAFVLVVTMLAWTEMRMYEKSSYTMMRLLLSRRQLFVVKTIYNVACLVVLFVVQIWLAIWMICSYEKVVQLELPAPQLVFLSFYRNDFLHCVLPMQEIGKWIRNILMILALSMSAAGNMVIPGEKMKNKYLGTTILVSLTLPTGWFVSSVGKNLLDMFCNLLFLGYIAVEVMKVYGVFGGLEVERKEEQR